MTTASSVSRWKTNLPLIFWAALMLLMAAETVVLAFSSQNTDTSSRIGFVSPDTHVPTWPEKRLHARLSVPKQTAPADARSKP